MSMANTPHVTAIILAGGCGSRMSCGITKQRILICGKSMLYHTVRAFSECDMIDSIVVVGRADEIEWAKVELSCFQKIFAVVTGGANRAESARSGFMSIPDCAELVAIHDAARCLITAEQICAVVEAAIIHKAATACTPVSDTLKILDSDNFIFDTMPRGGLVCAHTPQVFDRQLYASALSEVELDECITDDNIIIEKIGKKIYPVDTGRQNIKVTTADDLSYAEYIIERRSTMGEVRIGHGYDVHRFAEGRRLILGGVEIAHSRGLLGHSDADVLTHAIMDALLGACGLGDIGRHFSDSDEEYKDISSLVLLDRVGEMLRSGGFSIVNIDATIVMQAPKVAGYIDGMINNIAKTLMIESGRINIKATTEERLGFTGREEGVSAHAVASVKK